MNLENITWERIVAYFVIAAGAVFALWKSLPPFLVWLDARRNKKLELLKLDKTDTAEFRKAELEHDIKLEELIDKKVRAFIEMQDEEILEHKGEIIALKREIKARDEAEEKKKPKYLEKLFMIRENQRELKMLEAEVLKLENAAEFQKLALESIGFLKTQLEKQENLLT